MLGASVLILANLAQGALSLDPNTRKPTLPAALWSGARNQRFSSPCPGWSSAPKVMRAPLGSRSRAWFQGRRCQLRLPRNRRAVTHRSHLATCLGQTPPEPAGRSYTQFPTSKNSLLSDQADPDREGSTEAGEVGSALGLGEVSSFSWPTVLP